MTTSSESSSLSPELVRVAGLISRGYGVDPDAARLLAMQVLGAIVGPTLRVRGINGAEPASAFDLALLDEGKPLLHGAQMAALDPILGALQAAQEREAAHGDEVTRYRLAALRTKIKELDTSIRLAEERLASLKAVPDYSTMSAQELFTRISSAPNRPPVGPQITMLEASIRSLRQEAAVKHHEMADWRLVSASGIVRDDAGWEGLPAAGRESFDGSVLHLGSALSLVEELESLPPAWLRSCRKLLHRSRQPSPLGEFAGSASSTICSMQISGDHFTFSRLLQNSKLTQSGFFGGFIWCESGGHHGYCEPDAMAELSADKFWRDLLTLQLTRRLCGARDTLLLDRAGVDFALEFKNWMWSFRAALPAEQQWSFTNWNELLVSFGAVLALFAGHADGKVLGVQYLRAAGELLKQHAPRQAAILDRLTPKSEASERLDAKVDKIVLQLVRRGPLTHRELVRTFDDQRYAVSAPWLAEAQRRGLVVQRGDRFHLANVSVSGREAEKVVDFSRGAAA